MAVLRFPASVPAGNAHVRSDGQTETVAQGFVFVWQVNLLNEPPCFLHTQTHPDYACFIHALIQICTHTFTQSESQQLDKQSCTVNSAGCRTHAIVLTEPPE